MRAAQKHFAPVLGQPLEVDALTVFAETRLDLILSPRKDFPCGRLTG